MSDNSVTVCIPSIPTRSHFLKERALPSVFSQTYPVSEIAIAIDHDKKGAWENRNNAIKMANSEWIAFLDDDDEFLPDHLSTLVSTATESNADVVWGWFDVVGGTDPFPQSRGVQWTPESSLIFPITCLVRRSLILDADAKFKVDEPSWGSWFHQDFPFWKNIHDAGGKFLAIPDITWNWHHHGTNTSGLPNRW